MMNRGGMGRQLLGVGRASGRGGGGDSWIHHVGLGLSSAAVLVAVWAFTVTPAILSARAERIQARQPVFVRTDSTAVGRWYERVDQTDGRQFSVVFLSPGRPGAHPPPGIPSWPGPGEVFLSPALLNQPEAAELRSRYGRFIGPIARSGLADPGELLAYVGPRDPTAALAPRAQGDQVYGFGGPRRSPESFASQQTDVGRNDVYWILMCLVGLPALVFAIVAARSGAERRDRRVALLEALGAPRRALAWLLIGESAGAIAVGVGVATAALFAATLRDLRLPVAGYVIAAADLARLRPGLVGAAVAVAVGMLLLVVGLHGRSRPRLTTRPRGSGAPLPGWRLTVFGVGVVLSVTGALIGHSLGERVFLLGLLATLTGTPLVAGRISALLGSLIARWGARRGRVAAIVGGRWLAARPATIARVSSALVIGLGLLLQVQLRNTTYSTDESAARAVYQQIGPSLLTVQTRGIDQRSATGFQADLGPGQHVLVIDQPADGPTVVTAPCAVLRGLDRLTRCPSEATPAEVVYPRTSVRALALRFWSGLLAPDSLIKGAPAKTSATTVGLLVLNPDGEAGLARVKQSAYAHLRTPIVLTPGQGAIGGAHNRVRQIAWTLLFGGFGLLVLTLLAAVASATTFAQQAKDLGPLAAYSSSPRLFIAIAMWNVTLPLAAAAAIGAGVAGWLGFLQLTLDGPGHPILSLPLLSGSVLALWVAAAGAGVVCAQVAARTARTWRPQAD